MTRPLVLTVILCAVGTAALFAGEPDGQRLYLKNGDRLTGMKAWEGDGIVEWKSMFGEILEIPSDQVEKIEVPDEVKPATTPASAATAPAPAGTPAVPPPVVTPPPTPEQLTRARAEVLAAEEEWRELEHPWAFQTLGMKFWHGVQASAYNWTKRLTVGARYLTGNSDETMANLQADFERNNNLANMQIQAGGQFGKSNGVRGTNRWYANSTTDFHTPDKWIWFIKHTDEYDEFQNLDYRGTLSAGLGYRFFNEDKRRLIARLGPTGVFEVFRRPRNERLTYDMVAELESRWPLYQRVQFEQKTTVYPNLEDAGLIRINATANIMISLDERDCWNLQFGLQDQYLSRPNPGRVPHDLWTNLSIVYQRK